VSGLVASGFTTGAWLSWALPLAILLIVWSWWLLSLRRGARRQ
jgi:hypothetical protein